MSGTTLSVVTTLSPKPQEPPTTQSTEKLRHSSSATSNASSTSKTCSPTATTKEPPVQVFLRMRPLIREEQGHDIIEYKHETTTTTTSGRQRAARFQVKLPSDATTNNKNAKNALAINPVFKSAPPLKGRQGGTWRAFDGYKGILLQHVNNVQAYQWTVQPVVVQTIAAQNQSACIFTYGHTGSGKSHTLLGYGDELGIYKFAAADLLDILQAQDASKCLMVRVTQLYKDQVQDLITGKPCSLRQDSKGQVWVRGPMVEDDQGRLEQEPLGTLCATAQQVVDCVEAACASRRVGISTHHSQSSRSHLVLELEVVTPQWVQQRNLLVTQEAQLTRLKWLQTERSKTDRPLPKWSQHYSTSQILRREIQATQTMVADTRKLVAKSAQGLGGTLVFCDLAGNEYARDAAESTKLEMEEAAEINKSLLAVKETIRSLSSSTTTSSSSKQQPHKHVSYRDSKLTMVLARHLQTKAVMLAHISPSQDSLKKTINTLNYSSMVGSSSSTNGNNNGSSNGSSNGNKNKQGKQQPRKQ